MSESSERLDRIEAILLNASQVAASNARAIQANAEAITESNKQRELLAQDLMQGIHQIAEEGDRRRDETNRQLQAFIDEGKAYRAQSQRELAAFTEESERQRTVFTEAFQQLLGQLVAKLNSIGDRIEQIWERLNAA